MTNTTFINTDYIPAEKETCEKASAGIWHYIKVFCSFFSLIATFSALLTFTEVRTNHTFLILVMWGMGVISALLVSPGKFFKFGFSIMSACAVFGWFLLPFPLDLVTVAASVVVGLVAVIMAMIAIPAIFTIYTYITDTRYECVDPKKDLLAALAALGSVALAIGLFFSLQGITKLAEAPKMESTFDPAAIYSRYCDESPSAAEYPAEELSSPISSVESDDGYIRTNSYSFTVADNNIYYNCDVDIEFDFHDGRWHVSGVNEEKEIANFDPITATFTGEGKYFGNLSYSNVYTFNFENLTAAGGSGSLNIYLEETIDETKTFTVRIDSLRILTDPIDRTENAVANLTIIPDEPIVYDVFGSEEQITEIPCQYSLTNAQIVTTAFSFAELVLQ